MYVHLHSTVLALRPYLQIEKMTHQRQILVREVKRMQAAAANSSANKAGNPEVEQKLRAQLAEQQATLDEQAVEIEALIGMQAEQVGG